MPTKGDTWIADCNMVTDSLEGRKHIGYMPEAVPLYTDMTVRDYLDSLPVSGNRTSPHQKRIDEVVTFAIWKNILILLSVNYRGFQAKSGISSIDHSRTEVLILDEPTVVSTQFKYLKPEV